MKSFSFMKPAWGDQHQFCSLPPHSNDTISRGHSIPKSNPPNNRERERLTLKRTEATVHDQLEITQLTLSQDDSGELLSLSGEFGLAGGIAGEEVLEDTTVGRVGHCEGVEGYKQNREKELKERRGRERGDEEEEEEEEKEKKRTGRGEKK